MVDDIQERGKTTIVVEATLLVCPQSQQWRSAIALVRRTAGLEIVNANLGGGMRIQTRLGIERWYMAA